MPPHRKGRVSSICHLLFESHKPLLGMSYKECKESKIRKPLKMQQLYIYWNRIIFKMCAIKPNRTSFNQRAQVVQSLGFSSQKHWAGQRRLENRFRRVSEEKTKSSQYYKICLLQWYCLWWSDMSKWKAQCVMWLK